MRLGVASSEVAGYNLAVRETGECFFEPAKKSIASGDRTKEKTLAATGLKRRKVRPKRRMAELLRY